jgi:transcriptional regulator with XRE-family HTH domain
MPRTRLTNYLRTERLRSGLSQEELGELLGLSRSAITKMEGKRNPSAQLIISTKIVFDRHPHHLFPEQYDALQHDILSRALLMTERFADCADAPSQRKYACLCALITRIQSSPSL